MKRRSVLGMIVVAGGCAISNMPRAQASACPEPVDGLKFELYREPNGDWRWRLKSRNGNVIADSAEGYRQKSAALNGVSLVRGAYAAPIAE